MYVRAPRSARSRLRGTTQLARVQALAVHMLMAPLRGHLPRASHALTSRNAARTSRASHMSGAEVLRLVAAHETVTQFHVVERVLRKEVPTKVLLVARALLRRIGTRVADMPDVAEEAALVHCLANAAVARVE